MKKTSKILITLCMILAIVTMSVISFADGEGSGVTPGDFKPGTVTATSGILKLGGQIVGVVTLLQP